jgi:hypothetical protein
MNAQETLPTELRMSAPPALPQARSYLFKQRSEYTEYDMGKGTKIRINIPRLQRTYLSKDSYLRFRLNIDFKSNPDNLSTRMGGLYLDRAGAYSLFDRMEVYDYMGGTLIEQVNNLPALMVMLNDVMTPIESFNSKLQSTQGFEGSMVGVNQNSAETFEFRTSNSGQRLVPEYWNEGGTKNGNNFATFEFAIPLPSFLGNFSNKFVPLHNGFSIDLFLNNVNQAFISYGMNQNLPPAGTVWTKADPPLPPTYYTTQLGSLTDIGQVIISNAWISNAELCAQVMELGNDAENLVLSSNGSGPLVVPSTFFRYFTDLIRGSGEADQTSSVGIDLNLNVVSLKNIRFGMRPAKWQNNLGLPAYGHRIRNFLENFSFRYGSSYLPELAGVNARSSNVPRSRVTSSQFFTSLDGSKADGYTQAYAELLKTGPPHHWNDPKKLGSITPSEYNVDLMVGPPPNLPQNVPSNCTRAQFQSAPLGLAPPLGKYYSNICGKFMGGLDLRLSSKDVVSGIDTNGLLVRLNAKFDEDNLVNMVNAVLDIYAEHDAFVQIIPGVATTVTF